MSLADSLRPHLLHQPGAPAAWWFPREDVRTGLFTDAGQGERHPLFGTVELLDLHVGDRREPALVTRHPDIPELRDLVGFDWRRIGDRLHEDLVWRYPTPREDGRRVAGRYAVHHERCHTEVDGLPLDGGSPRRDAA